jgi:hypothetical protein
MTHRADISSTLLQPFVSYTTPTAWTTTLNTESSYDWNEDQWSVPLNLAVSKVTRIGSPLVSLGGGARGTGWTGLRADRKGSVSA